MLKNRIEAKLKKAFSPLYLEVVDESHLHEGHDNHKPGESTHFSVKLISDVFSGMNRIDRHKQVYEALDKEIKDGVHALHLKLISPEESIELV